MGRMRIRTRPSKNRPHRRFAALYIALSFLTFLILGITITAFRPQISQSRYGPLPVPQLPELSFSGPLSLTTGGKPILGATTFDATDIVTDVNRERQARGIAPLRISEALTHAAKERADTIMRNQNFSHQDPYDHVELGTVLPGVGYRFSYASENIGMGGGNAADFVYGFMHSAAHRQNLLDPRLVDTGVATATGPYHSWYVTVAVQIFAVPGGETEYLGYSDADIELYRSRLAAVNGELNPFDWTIQTLLRNPAYSQTRYRTLVTQRQTLLDVYTMMQRHQPLTADAVSAIRTFNQTL